jgi:hypothetical protein
MAVLLCSTIALRGEGQVPLAPLTDEEKATAIREAAEFLGLAVEELEHASLSGGSDGGPARTIGILADVPLPVPAGGAEQVSIEVRMMPRPFVRRAQWRVPGTLRLGEGLTPSAAHNFARAYAARQFSDWDDRRSVLTRVKANATGDGGRATVQFHWAMADGGLSNGRCEVQITGDPPRVIAYGCDVPREFDADQVAGAALGCILPLEVLVRQQWAGLPALLSTVRFLPSLPSSPDQRSAWEVAASGWPRGFDAQCRTIIDAATAEVLWPRYDVDDPELAAAARRGLQWRPAPAPTAPPGPDMRQPDDDEALRVAAKFLGVAPERLGLRGLRWEDGAAGWPRALLTAELEGDEGARPRAVELEVQGGARYCVSKAEARQPPGLWTEDIDLRRDETLARGYAESHFPGWTDGMVAELRRPTHADTGFWAAGDYWFHGTQELVRTGSWCFVEVRHVPPDAWQPCYVSRYEARLAPEHRIDEMTVDLLEAVATLRKEVEAQPGATFLLDYGVPTLSHPASPTQNPAWEVRYFVGPGGPEPVVRWGAADATDGSIIYIDRDKPECCFPGPH